MATTRRRRKRTTALRTSKRRTTPSTEERAAGAAWALPKSVRIGPYDFRIEKWDACEARYQGAYGQCNVGELRISIDTEMSSPVLVVDTFLHELYHAILWAWAIRRGDDEEHLVRPLATAWTQVYRDNPWLLSWIAEALA